MKSTATKKYSSHLVVTVEIYKVGETEIKRVPGYRKRNTNLFREGSLKKSVSSPAGNSKKQKPIKAGKKQNSCG